MEKKSICWNCSKTCGGCSWSKNFIPVKGWDAIETIVDGNSSFLVKNCPEFKSLITPSLKVRGDVESYLLFKQYGNILPLKDKEILIAYFTYGCKKVAEKFDLSERTFYRKIKYLKERLKSYNKIYKSLIRNGGDYGF